MRALRPLVLTVAFLMALLTGTESVTAAVKTWNPSAPVAEPGERPQQVRGSAEGREHRVGTADTVVAGESVGRGPREAPGQLPLEEREPAGDLGGTEPLPSSR